MGYKRKKSIYEIIMDFIFSGMNPEEFIQEQKTRMLENAKDAMFNTFEDAVSDLHNGAVPNRSRRRRGNTIDTTTNCNKIPSSRRERKETDLRNMPIGDMVDNWVVDAETAKIMRDEIWERIQSGEIVRANDYLQLGGCPTKDMPSAGENYGWDKEDIPSKDTMRLRRMDKEFHLSMPRLSQIGR